MSGERRGARKEVVEEEVLKAWANFTLGASGGEGVEELGIGTQVITHLFCLKKTFLVVC